MGITVALLPAIPVLFRATIHDKPATLLTAAGHSILFRARLLDTNIITQTSASENKTINTLISCGEPSVDFVSSMSVKKRFNSHHATPDSPLLYDPFFSRIDLTLSHYPFAPRHGKSRVKGVSPTFGGGQLPGCRHLHPRGASRGQVQRVLKFCGSQPLYFMGHYQAC